MRRLHADDDVGILLDGLGAALHIHLVHGLFQVALHPVGDDVQKGQHPHLGAIDDFFLFQKKRVGSRTSRVHHGGHAGLQRDVRGDPVRGQVGTALRGKPVERRAAVADVDVNIDEPGGDVEPGGVHHLSRLAGGNIFFDGGDFVFYHRHVHHSIHIVRGINHVAALQQQIVTGRLGRVSAGIPRIVTSDTTIPRVLVHSRMWGPFLIFLCVLRVLCGSMPSMKPREDASNGLSLRNEIRILLTSLNQTSKFIESSKHCHHRLPRNMKPREARLKWPRSMA